MFEKRRDAASYDTYAEYYERYIQHLSDPLAERICALAQMKTGDHVLDVGTGSGIAARQASRIVGLDGSVLGIDLSEGMIEVAKQSVAQWEGQPPEFRVMDAESLDLPDATFHAVISLCAVRHFPDIARAIAQMRRVLKPGGHLVISFGYARPIALFALSLHLVKRLWGTILNPLRPQIVGPAYLIGHADRLLPHPTQVIETEWGSRNPRGTLVRLVQESGFERVEENWYGHAMVFDSAQEFWDAQSSIVTEVRKRVMDAPPEAVALLKQTFITGAEGVLRRGGKLVYPYGAFYVSGQRPMSP